MKSKRVQNTLKPILKSHLSLALIYQLDLTELLRRNSCERAWVQILHPENNFKIFSATTQEEELVGTDSLGSGLREKRGTVLPNRS